MTAGACAATLPPGQRKEQAILDVTVSDRALTRERAAAALREALGQRYFVEVSGSSPDRIDVRRNAVERACVLLRPAAGGTRLVVRPGWPFLLNLFAITPRVARALRRLDQRPGARA
jgi:hypothetical protein